MKKGSSKSSDNQKCIKSESHGAWPGINISPIKSIPAIVKAVELELKNEKPSKQKMTHKGKTRYYMVAENGRSYYL